MMISARPSRPHARSESTSPIGWLRLRSRPATSPAPDNLIAPFEGALSFAIFARLFLLSGILSHGILQSRLPPLVPSSNKSLKSAISTFHERTNGLSAPLQCCVGLSRSRLSRCPPSWSCPHTSQCSWQSSRFFENSPNRRHNNSERAQNCFRPFILVQMRPILRVGFQHLPILFDMNKTAP
jgi:hypothetical protein